MGRSGPLDHPELREVEKMLDTQDVAAAQRLLANLGTTPGLADGIAYLTTRVLHARGRLDLGAVADRLRDLVSRSPDFPEARALLAQAESGRIRSRPPTGSGPPPPSGPSPADAQQKSAATDPDVSFGTDDSDAVADDDRISSEIDTSAARQASWPPLPPSAHPGKPAKISTGPPTVPASPQAPRPDARDAGAFESAPPSTQDGIPRRRQYAPLGGMDSFVTRARVAEVPSSPPSGGGGVPEIPKAPGIPQFRDNRSAPSYVPPHGEPEFDPLKTKSLLPRDAGRYSQTPSAEVLESKKPRPTRSPPGQARAGGSSGPPRETVPHTPNRRRAGGASQDQGSIPTLFEIASWIDEGRHKEAIAAINRAGPEAGVEYAVLRARALAAAGYVDQAVTALNQLEAEPLLEPELRAGCARLLAELGDPDRALVQARIALEADPELPVVRITFALAAVRKSRRRHDPVLLEQAERVLSSLGGREGPLPALCQALRACIQCGLGDAERAISIAQRALGLDPRSPDALAAIAEASARLGQVHDARQAWMRLHEISVDEASALATVLGRLGAPVGDEGERDTGNNERSPLWSPAEVELAAGHRSEAVRKVEEAADDTMRRLAKTAAQSGLTALATVAASFLTTTPIFSSFAPFDASLWSIRRLEAALDVLYGPERRPRVGTDDGALVLLLGAYLGESLRLAHGGRWHGHIGDPEEARVTVRERHWHPFRIVAGRLHQGARTTIGDAVSAALHTQGGEPWQSRLANPVAPPVPWAPHAWPRPSQIGALARSLSRSPVGRYCQDLAEGPLDRSTSSLIALDSYVALIAPTTAPPDPDAAWTRRLAVLVGGYVGETLRELVGGDWVYGVDTAEDALAFRLVLRENIEATPVAHVLERAIGARTSSLVDYAKTLMRRAGHAGTG